MVSGPKEFDTELGCSKPPSLLSSKLSTAFPVQPRCACENNYWWWLKIWKAPRNKAVSIKNKAKKFAKQPASQVNHGRLIKPFTIKLLAVKKVWHSQWDHPKNFEVPERARFDDHHIEFPSKKSDTFSETIQKICKSQKGRGLKIIT